MITTDSRNETGISHADNSDVGVTGLNFPRLASQDSFTASGSTGIRGRIRASWNPTTVTSRPSPSPTFIIQKDFGRTDCTHKTYDDKKPLYQQRRFAIYNLAPSVPIVAAPTYDATPADHLFDTVIRKSPEFNNHYVSAKRQHWRNLYHAAARALRSGGCVRIDRSTAHTSRALLNVIDAAVERDLFRECRSPQNSPKQSRLIPMPVLVAHLSSLPLPPPVPSTFVRVHPRKSKLVMSHDANHPVAKDTQHKLELINDVNGRFNVTYRRYDFWEDRFAETRQCRPLHCAHFTDGFDLHGRLYGDGFSHQNLRTSERQMIRFDGEPSIELDYSGMHPRMLYHSLGLPFDDDPYKPWIDTTDDERYILKRVLNAALNAKSRSDSIGACIKAMKTTTNKREIKSDKALEKAIRLRTAKRKCGFSFEYAYDYLAAAHAPIAHFFGQDKGIELMRRDSRIALNVLYHFAERSVPCLGVHDSFIVRAQHESELREVMRRCYRDEMKGFDAIIKDCERIDVSTIPRVAA